MAESFKDQVLRVRMMAKGEPTWDLSRNDTAALNAVLNSFDEMLSALKAWRGYWSGAEEYFGDTEREMFDNTESVIDRAEATQ